MSSTDPMAGKTGFAPVSLREDGKDVFLVARVTYGALGYDRAKAIPAPSFERAEELAEKLNLDAGLSAEEAWLLIENTVMGSR